jgi:hypothetical protein
MGMFVRHDARQFTIKQTLFGPMLYVRCAGPSHAPGDFEWGTRLNDQHGRTDVYEAIVEFLK